MHNAATENLNLKFGYFSVLLTLIIIFIFLVLKFISSWDFYSNQYIYKLLQWNRHTVTLFAYLQNHVYKLSWLNSCIYNHPNSVTIEA